GRELGDGLFAEALGLVLLFLGGAGVGAVGRRPARAFGGGCRERDGRAERERDGQGSRQGDPGDRGQQRGHWVHFSVGKNGPLSVFFLVGKNGLSFSGLGSGLGSGLSSGSGLGSGSTDVGLVPVGFLPVGLWSPTVLAGTASSLTSNAWLLPGWISISLVHGL